MSDLAVKPVRTSIRFHKGLGTEKIYGGSTLAVHTVHNNQDLKQKKKNTDKLWQITLTQSNKSDIVVKCGNFEGQLVSMKVLNKLS